MAVLTNVSLRFKGVDAYLENTVRQSLGFGNLWTISLWLKPFEDLPREKLTQINHRTLLHLKGAAHKNEILIWADRITDTSPDVIHVENWNCRGERVRITRFNMAQQRNEWRNFSVFWDGTNLIGWDNAIEISDTHETLSGTGGFLMEDPVASAGRSVRIGAAYSGIAAAVELPLSTWSGLMGPVAIWNTGVTDQELGVVVSGNFGLDLATNSGTYTSSANLVHWWRVGADSADIGADYATTVTGINVGDAATISGTNEIVVDSPTI